MAQSQQMMQQPIGEYAALAAASTPGGKHPVAPGTSPNAKRPLDRSTFERAAKGVPKPMSADEVNAGFHNLVQLQARDEK